MALALLDFVCVPFEMAIKLKKGDSTEFSLAEKNPPPPGLTPFHR